MADDTPIIDENDPLLTELTDEERASGVITLDGPETRIPVYSPVCTYCKWWAPTKGTRECKAYPTDKGIPMPIWNADVTHVFPYKGDHGIQFETADGVKKLPGKIAADLKKREQQGAAEKTTPEQE